MSSCEKRPVWPQLQRELHDRKTTGYWLLGQLGYLDCEVLRGNCTLPTAMNIAKPTRQRERRGENQVHATARWDHHFWHFTTTFIYACSCIIQLINTYQCWWCVCRHFTHALQSDFMTCKQESQTAFILILIWRHGAKIFLIWVRGNEPTIRFCFLPEDGLVLFKSSVY